MRILFLLYEYDRRVRGGMGGFRHALELAEHWTRMGHQVTILRPRLRKAEEPTPVPVVEIPIIDLPILRPLIVYALLFAAGVLRSVRGRPDVLYSREMFAPAPVLLARLFGRPVLVEVNGDSYAHRSARRSEPRWRLALFRRIQRFNFERCDRIVAVTEGLRRALLTRFSSLPPEKVVVIENGTNIEHLRPLEPDACRRKLGLPERARYVGFAGTFFRYQGIQTLIGAAPLILKECPDVRFLIVGDGEMREEWGALVRRLGLEAAFDFPGQVPYEAIPYYLGAMDLCVAPFTADRGEGSPLKLFDYMASGRPVIVSEIATVKPLIERSGVLVPVLPDDPPALARAVLRILAQDDERRRLGEEGRDFVVREQSWEAVARRVLAVCEAALVGRA